MEAASALAVQAKVLGKRLSNDQLEALFDEKPDGGSIAVQVARSEALVGAIEEGEVFLRLHERRDLAPLVESRVDTCRVVGTSVQEDNAAVGGIFQGSLHPVEIQTLGLLVEVRVGSERQADIGENLVVVRPSGIAQVD